MFFFFKKLLRCRKCRSAKSDAHSSSFWRLSKRVLTSSLLRTSWFYTSATQSLTSHKKCCSSLFCFNTCSLGSVRIWDCRTRFSELLLWSRRRLTTSTCVAGTRAPYRNTRYYFLPLLHIFCLDFFQAKSDLHRSCCHLHGVSSVRKQEDRKRFVFIPLHMVPVNNNCRCIGRDRRHCWRGRSDDSSVVQSVATQSRPTLPHRLPACCSHPHASALISTKSTRICKRRKKLK